jgi:hypothetical protein
VQLRFQRVAPPQQLFHPRHDLLLSGIHFEMFWRIVNPRTM